MLSSGKLVQNIFMTKNIITGCRKENFNIILEIGCGTGYSILALLENGHKVIAIEKNISV